MADSDIAILRWVLLAAAVACLLQATVLNGWLRRRILEPWHALNERSGHQVPRIMRDQRAIRLWLAFMAVVFIVIWWYLGSDAAGELIRVSRG